MKGGSNDTSIMVYNKCYLVYNNVYCFNDRECWLVCSGNDILYCYVDAGETL